MSVRDPVRLLDVSQVANAYPNELLVNFQTGELTILDANKNPIKNGVPGSITIKSGNTSILVKTSLDGDVVVDMSNMLSSTAAAAAGTAAAGTSTLAARADHVHPLQTSVNGNAGTATKLASAVSIGLSGVTANAVSFDGSDNVTIEVTEIPASLVTGLLELGNTAGAAPTASGTAGTATTAAKSDHTHPIQTSVSGNAGTATEFESAQTVELTGDVTGSASSTAGWTLAVTLANSGVTAGTYGESAAKTADFGDSINVPKVTVDAKGRVTSASNVAVTLPAAPTDITGNAGTATKLAASKNFSITGGATAAAVGFDGSGNVALNVTSLDATKLSGLVPFSSIPQGALERLVIVANETALLALTTSNVQNGDTVKVEDPGIMYYVKDETKLGTMAAFEPYAAGAASSVEWANVQNKPSIPEAGSGTTAVSAGDTASAGSATTWARSDHQHNLPDSGVTAGSYGPADGGTLDHGGSFKTVLVTVDKKGRVTSAAEKTFTLPAQYTHPSYTSRTAGLYKVTVDNKGHISAVSAVTKADITALGIPAQDTQYTHPSYTSRTNGFYKVTVDATGHISAVTAVAKSDITALGIPAQDTTYTAGTGLGLSGTEFSLADTAVTAGSYGESEDATPGHGESFTVPKFTVDGQGRLTAAENINVTLPAQYSHPAHTAKSSGLYKVTVDALGHVTAATAVTKSDITGLGIPAQDTQYTHPTYTSKTSGLYKITVDGTGHVSAATAVAKSDITGLGIPAQDTTYSAGTGLGLSGTVFSLANTAVTADSYGPADDIAPGHGESFVVPNITVDAQGRLTFAADREVTLPAQYTHPSHTAAASGLYKVTVDALGHVTAATAVVKKDITDLGIPAQDTQYTHPTYTSKTSGLYKITVNSLGHVSAATAVAKSDITGLGIPAQDTTYTAGTGLGLSGTEFSLADTAVTAGSYGEADDATPGYGGTFAVPTFTVDAQGRLTAAGESTITLPAQYSHPTYTAKNSGLYKITVNSLGHVSTATAVTKADITGLGIPGENTVYTHPTYTSKTSGLYKITVDGTGHVSAATAVEKSDITGLGIPGENTTYTNGTGLGLSGTTFSLANTAVTAGTYGVAQTANTTLGFGGTIRVPKFTVDAQGRLTAASHIVLTLPAAPTSVTGNAGTATKLAASKNFSITGGATAAAVGFDGSSDVALNVTSLDATTLSGTIPLACMPAGALERVKIVADSTAMLALTSDDVQNGDTVKLSDSGLMYFVKDDTKLGTTDAMDAFEPYTVGSATNAATADAFSSAKTIALTGDVSGTASSTAGWSIATALANTGVTAGNYGPSAGSTLAHSGTFTVPYITVDAKGRLTAASTKSFTLPAQYTHPTYTSKTSGLYKITVDGTGHVSGTASVAKSDLTGIIGDFGAASSSAAGTTGLVPAPGSGKQNSFLRGDGNWVVPTDTDTKVTQTANTGSTALKVLLTTSGSPTSGNAAGAAYASGVTVTPSTGTVTATNFAGNINGFSIGMSVPAGSKLTDTTYTAGTGLGLDGTEFSLADTAVTAGSYGPTQTSATTLAHSGTFNVPKFTVDAQGRLTAAGHITFTLPASGNTDTKVTQTANTGSTALPILIGATASPSGAAAAAYAAGVTVTPSTKTVTATNFVGKINGFDIGMSVPAGSKLTDTTYTAGTGLSLSETEFSLADTAVSAGNYGPSAGSTLAHSGTFTVPYITVDAQGRITAASTKTFTLPGSGNTDTKVTQTASTSTSALPILIGATASPSGAATAAYAAGVTVTPSTGTITATKFSGDFIGTLNGTTIPSSPKLTDTTYTAGTGLSLDGTEFSLADTAVTSGSYGPSAGSTLAHGGSFTVPYITVDAKGRLTAASTKSFTLPASGNTDTYVSAASFADDTANTPNSPVKLSLTRSGTITTAVIANLPKVSSSSAGVVPKGAAVSSQSQSTKFLREDGTWAAPSYTSNTDTKVTQTASSSTSALPLLASTSTAPAGSATTTVYKAGVTLTPSTSTITATNFAGKINGFDIGMSVPAGSKLTDTTYTAGTGLSLDGTEFSLADTAVTSGNYGPSAGSTLAHSGTFTVPYITVDAQGRITAASTKTFTLPASGNTDTKVTQTANTGTTALPILIGATASPSGADTAAYVAGVTITPSTKTVTATTFSGDFVGTLNGTAIPASPKLTDTTYTNGTGLNLSGTTFSLADTAVTAGDYGPTQTAATTLAYSGTFNVPKFTVDAQGRLTSAGHITFTLPASDNTDTKVTMTSSSTSGNFPLLTTNTASPTSGSAYGSYYDTSVYLNHSTKMLTTVGLTVSTAGNVSGVQKSWTTLSLPTGSSWSGSAAPYTYALTVSGILASDIPTVDMRPSGTYATDKTMEENWCQVYRGVTSANTITFYAHEKPSAAIPITIKVVR